MILGETDKQLKEEYNVKGTDMKIRIIIAAHKCARLPDDPLYLPIQVGAAGKKPLFACTDDTGDNISVKNGGFCELTGLYWAWKNLPADAVGLCHYRRYFCRTRIGNRWKSIITSADAEKLLTRVPLVLPHMRRYWIETNYSQYVHAHHRQDLAMTREILRQNYPEYLTAYDNVMSRTKGHRFNMFLMRRSLLDEYCSWLFNVLFALEERLDVSDYSDYDKRVFGFVAERLLDVWVEKNSVHYAELPVRNMENQPWGKKITRFLYRKFVYHSE